jgi:hypothetical protein
MHYFPWGTFVWDLEQTTSRFPETTALKGLVHVAAQGTRRQLLFQGSIQMNGQRQLMVSLKEAEMVFNLKKMPFTFRLADWLYPIGGIRCDTKSCKARSFG